MMEIKKTLIVGATDKRIFYITHVIKKKFKKKKGCVLTHTRFIEALRGKIVTSIQIQDSDKFNIYTQSLETFFFIYRFRLVLTIQFEMIIIEQIKKKKVTCFFLYFFFHCQLEHTSIICFFFFQNNLSVFYVKVD